MNSQVGTIHYNSEVFAKIRNEILTPFSELMSRMQEQGTAELTRAQNSPMVPVGALVRRITSGVINEILGNLPTPRISLPDLIDTQPSTSKLRLT